MKAKKILCVVTLVASTVVVARDNGNTPDQDFADFRKGLFDDFNDFRKSVLDDYADFLNKEWGEFQTFKSEKRFADPKPKELPKAKPQKPVADVDVPAPKVAPLPQTPDDDPAVKALESGKKLTPDDYQKLPRFQRGIAQSKGKAPVVKPKEKPTDVPKTTPTPKFDVPAYTPDPEPEAPVAEAPKARPDTKPDTKPEAKPATTPETKSAAKPAAEPQPKPKPQPKMFAFKFYNLDAEVPDVKYDIRRTMQSLNAEAGQQWEELSKTQVKTRVLPALQKIADQWGLNDYLTYEFYKAYVKARFPGYDDKSCASLLHYLLANDGYDVRLSMLGSYPAIGMPITQEKIWGAMRVTLDGRNYYLYTFNDKADLNGISSVQTAKLPGNAYLGRAFDMRVGKLNVPYTPKPYTVKFGDITINGEVNANIYPMLYRYPQMPMGDFAMSSIDPELRKQVVAQVKQALAEKPKLEALNTLLHFVQKGFAYATDDENHGFEKPYFFEETLFYDKCDCEDRSIFYSYLVWEIFGYQCHIINYPGHEAVAISTPEELGVRGDGYRYSGKRFYISDPTYINAETGQCMPDFVRCGASVDYEYK